MRNVTVERVTFAGTRQGIRIKSARGRGNDIGNFTYSDITMDGVETPIEITEYYTGMVKDDPGQPVTEHTPKFHDITIENVTATGAKRAAVIMGLPESPIKEPGAEECQDLGGGRDDDAECADHGGDVVITPASGDAVMRGPGVTINGK